MKWTIATVNWKSIEFIEYHANFFHSFADKRWEPTKGRAK